MHKEYIDKQPLFYNFVTSSIRTGKVSHAYLIETHGVSYAYDLTLDFVKYLLEDFSLPIDDGNYPDVKIIDSETMIKKEQMVDLQKLFSVKPLYGKYLIYVIKDASLLNSSSSNSMLKFLEEPSDDIIAILLVDNCSLLLDTIVSRCQVLSLIPDNNVVNDLENKLIEHYDMTEILEFYSDIEDIGSKVICYDPYRFKNNFDLILEYGLYLYMDVLYYLYDYKGSRNIKDEDIIRKIADKNDSCKVIKKLEIINKYIGDYKYNVNKDLFIDSFIINLGGVL